MSKKDNAAEKATRKSARDADKAARKREKKGEKAKAAKKGEKGSGALEMRVETLEKQVEALAHALDEALRTA